MEPQTPTQHQAQPPQAGSNTGYTATDGTQLNPTAVTLAKAIRTVESNGNYNAVGDNGQSHGAYQFNKNNFQNWAQEYGLNPNDMSPVNQDKVAYARIDSLLNKGIPPSQVAAIWNGAKYDNGQYQAINPQYVEKVKNAYQQIAGGQTSTGQKMLAPGVPALQISGQDQNQPQDKGFLSNLMSGNLLGAGKNALDFAFPIIGDTIKDIQGTNQKSALQQLGDAGLSALWFIPGLGEGAGIGAKILEGAGLGYGAGALSQLSSGKGLVQSITPNASNLIGAATGGVAGGVLSKLSGILGKNINEEGAVNALQNNIKSAITGTKSGANFLSDLGSRGNDAVSLIAHSNAIPDIVDGRLQTAPAEAVIQKNLGQIGRLRATALDSLGTNVSIEDLRNEALGKITGQDFPVGTTITPEELQRIERIKATGETGAMTTKVNKIFDDLKNSFGETLTPSQLETIKEAQAGASGIYKRTGQIGEQNASSIIGNVARNKIENIADEANIPSIKELNGLLKQHYDALSLLQKIDGQTVKGGRLGNMLRGHTIAGVSALGANAMGGGFLGTLAAALGGEGANNLLSKIFGETSFTNPVRDAILQKIETENPQIVKALQDYLAQQGSLPASMAGKIGAQLAPKASSKLAGLVPNLLTKTAARTGGLIAP